ncbi:RDD family protein [Luteococcus peritonei]|uniref:RDD family protein n=1 Tax=Luteococcus peritonei TaxID=88874 RepID=A0ABW4RS21_9ACTN
MSQADVVEEQYPGQRLGLPREGRGSLATWSQRLAALVIDWAGCTIIARLLFGDGVTFGFDWRRWTPMALYFVQKALLTLLVAGSFGQLVCRIAVVRLDGRPVGLLRSLARAAMKVLVVPAVVVGGDRRALDDLALGTVVVRRH